MRFRSDRGPIAVVGFAFRMPGARGDAFWDALLAGRDLVGEVATDRWAQESFQHPRKSEPASAYTFAAGSIGDVSGFDAAFFGISPREAADMDPQQRVLLEMAWEAFENASIPPSAMRGSRCGVYVGLSSLDYAYRHADDLGMIGAATMTGNAGSIAANRISYLFDLHGPSLAIDTACSSSLVALHQACQSIRHGECDAALACGISLHLHPYAFIGFSKASMLSRQGRCAPFDAAADGYVRSEGGAVLLLKPLAQAVADGNRILAVVAGTGVNSDGRKNGLTVPSYVAQAELLREVYERAGIAAAALDYFEAHGTGTAVGDPIEARAIGEALGRQRPADLPLPVGSVKGHVGHLEAAAGMAGLVKTLFVLRHRRVPANLHLTTPSAHIDFQGLNLAPLTRELALDPGRRVIVGVSAFGFGGTNAHAILTSYDVAPPAAPRPAVRPPLLLSARSPAALREVARDMAHLLRTRADLPEYDLAYSAFFGREVHPQRLLASGEDRAAVVSALERFAESGTATGVVTGRFRTDASEPAFVYCGNGSQWIGMGVQLLDEDATFRDSVGEIDALLAAHTDRSVAAELRAAAAESRIERTEVGQPALFAIQVGLTRMLARAGIRPRAVCGHSVGEVAAAWAAGALTLEAAVRVIHERSAHQALTRGHGGMTAVELAADDMAGLLHSLGLSQLVVAAVNAPGSVTVAGPAAMLTRLEGVLGRRAVAFRRLALDHAFHSEAMDVIRDGLSGSLADLVAQPVSIPLYSTVTGQLIEGTQLGAAYWWRNVREPVQFAAAIGAMLEAGVNTFVELGPRPVLTSYLNEIGRAGERAIIVLPSLTSQDPGASRVRTLGQQLTVCGALHDPARLFPVAGRMLDLPHYPWQRERHWHDPTAESLGTLQRTCSHPLLGYRVGDEPTQWENHLDTARLPGLADHAVGGAAVFPAAGFVEMALAAGAARRPGAPLVIEDLEILSPLLLERERSSTVRLRLDADGTFTILSRDRTSRDAWRTHATGRLLEETALGGATESPRALGPPDVTAAAHYELARTLGLEYGPAFQSVLSARFDPHGITGTLTQPPGLLEQGALLHPASLDGAFQLLADLVHHELGVAVGHADTPTFLPVRIERLELGRPARRVTAARAGLAATRHRSHRALLADFALYDDSGGTVAVARGVRFRAASVQRSARRAPRCLVTRAIAMPRRSGARAYPAPPPGELAAALAQHLHGGERGAARLRHAQEVEPLLDVLCASFAERTLRTLAGEGPVYPARLLASGQVCAEGAPLLQALVRMLAQDGVLESAGAGWRWSANAASAAHFPEPSDIWLSLIGDYPQYAPVTARVGSAGLRLLGRLRHGDGGDGSKPDGAPGALWWLESMTRDEAVALYDALGEALATIGAVQRPQARLRVLRIVGAAPPEELARSFWPAVDHDRCELVVAAGTQQVLDALRMRCPQAARVPGHLVDLEEPGVHASAALGGRFDVVILGEGLAGAADAAVRLQNLRRLLLDEGTLLVIDQHRSRSADLVFGMRPDWWEGVPAAGTETGPMSRWRSPQGWEGLLTAAGFESPAAVTDAAGTASGPYLMLMRATRSTAEEAPPYPDARARSTWLLLQDAAGDSAQLAAAVLAELEGHNQRVVRVTAGAEYSGEGASVTLDPGSATQWERLLAQLQANGTRPEGWIHLAGLDLASAAAAPADRAALQAARARTLLAWLQACGRSALRPACWVVGAHAGAALLPAAAAPPHEAAAVADGARDAALWGLTRVAQQEYPEQRVRWLDLLAPTPFGPSAAKLVRELLDPDDEDEVLLTADGRFVPRLDVGPDYTTTVAAAPPVAARFQLDFVVPGPLRNLRWRRHDEHAGGEAALPPGEIEIGVRATGLNFRDVMYAMGLLPDEAVENGFCGPALGIELAGVVLRTAPDVVEFAVGDAVMAIAPGAFATRVRTPAWAAVRQPVGWSHSAAATVPAVFFTAYYALVELARLREGERLLVHGAAGGVGIAALQIARHLGAEVFATAGNPVKRDFARLLGADHVLDSRSLGFADDILAVTGGEGVDVVLNSLAGEAMRRSVRLLRPFGRMLEPGKRDFYENSRLGLRPLRNNIAYFGIDAEQLLAHRPDTVRRCFAELQGLFAAGALRPLPHQSFCASDVEAAFRHMQPARHIGKIVVTYPEDFAPAAAAPRAVPGPQLRSDATYLVTGGLSGFGLRTAQWLAAQGARHLALLGRQGAASAEAQEAVRQLAARGVTVRAIACDVADADALAAALAAIDTHLPPLRGVVHAAAVIEDALIRDLDCEQLQRVLASKAGGGWCLHEATRHRELDFFVLYSSATALFGNPGQAAYVAANMALEALAAERRGLGLPATCIGFGPIGDAGYLARNEKIRDALLGRIGGQALESTAALAALGSLLAADAPPVAVVDLDWGVLGRFLPRAAAPKFSRLAALDARDADGAGQPQDLKRWLEGLAAGELLPALTEVVRAEIAQILRAPPERLDAGASLFELGMDSLMAVELATSIEVRLGIQLSALALSDGPTIERIAARIARQLRPGEDGEAPPAESGVAEQVRFVAAQHASEVSEGELREFSAALQDSEATTILGNRRA